MLTKKQRVAARHRWKFAERKIADELNRQFSDIGKFKTIERIPLLGREGPDLTVNESGLVINVKSRLEISRTLFPRPSQMLFSGDLVIFRLSDLGCLYTALMEILMCQCPILYYAGTNHVFKMIFVIIPTLNSAPGRPEGGRSTRCIFIILFSLRCKRIC